MSRIDKVGLGVLGKGNSLQARRIEGREWWLWGLAVTITLALTAAIVFLTFGPQHGEFSQSYQTELREWVRALTALVLMFDI